MRSFKAYLGLWFALFIIIALFYLAHFFLAADWILSYSSGMGVDELGSLAFSAIITTLIVSIFRIVVNRGRTRIGCLAMVSAMVLIFFLEPVSTSSTGTPCQRASPVDASPPWGGVGQLASMGYSLTRDGIVYNIYWVNPVHTAYNAWPIDGFRIRAGNVTVWGTFTPPPLSWYC